MPALLKTVPWIISGVLAIALVQQLNQYLQNQGRLKANHEAQWTTGPEEEVTRETPLEELERLRRNQDEMQVLRQEIAELQKQRTAALDQLRQRNETLREEVTRLETDPVTTESVQIYETSQLLQIAQAFMRYATLNSNRIPTRFAELESYAAAEVFSRFETDRFEIVARGNWNEISNPAETQLLRSRKLDRENQRLYLFADGHTELRKEVP